MALPVKVHKIGSNKGRPRIWLDDTRLTESGFTGGTIFRCDVAPGVIRLSTDPEANGAERKVSGRPDGKPIIDILGKDVETAFPNATHIAVTFRPGRIIIRATSHLES